MMKVRESLYKKNYFKKYKSNKKVISIGNLTLGGTGKTPMTLFIINWLLQNKKTPALVSRNYKADFKGTEKVQLGHPHGASYYGDEAFMVQSYFPDIPVYVGPKKSKTLELLDQREENVDTVVVDDGFQHWALVRDLDIVLLDATEKKNQYDLVPVGRGREPFAALKRADWILITKANLAQSDTLTWLKKQIPELKKNKVLQFDSFLGDFEPVFMPSGESVESPSEVVAFCGIARPKYFFQMIYEKANLIIKDEISFSDHHQYDQEDINEMLEKNPDAIHFVTTEKDFEKVLPYWPQDKFLWMLPLVFKPSEGFPQEELLNEFYQQIID